MRPTSIQFAATPIRFGSQSPQVELKNGGTASQKRIDEVTTALKGLLDYGMMGIGMQLPLLAACRDEQPVGGHQKPLQDAGLVEADGRVNAETRAIVLSALEGDHVTNLRQVDPV